MGLRLLLDEDTQAKELAVRLRAAGHDVLTANEAAVLADLGHHGKVLDVIREIDAVTLNANESELPALRALPCVRSADPDREAETGQAGPAHFAGAASQWSLDAINVTDAVGGRVVDYDGAGVYVAVLDTGLDFSWRSYFPEERIDAVHARAFGGGGGKPVEVSNKWEHDVNAHGTAVTSWILGFRYSGPELLPAIFNGVAPKATVIPIKLDRNNHEGGFSVSTVAHAVTYVANLKRSGALGDAPLVLNLSSGSRVPEPVWRAAIDYAIANGVAVVSVAHNLGASGMAYPGAYPEVISTAATGWIGQFLADDPIRVGWIVRDVPEGDPSQHYIASFSSRELPGQELDVAAPGSMVPGPWAWQEGRLDYGFLYGTSVAAPHVTGVAALMLQKNPHLTQAQIEAILKQTAMPLAPGCRDLIDAGAGPPGIPPTWGDHHNLFFFPATVCWDANATGHGLLQADAALAATP